MGRRVGQEFWRAEKESGWCAVLRKNEGDARRDQLHALREHIQVRLDFTVKAPLISFHTFTFIEIKRAYLLHIHHEPKENKDTTKSPHNKDKPRSLIERY